MKIEQKKRSEIEDRFKWKLNELFEGEGAFDESFEKAKVLYKKLEEFKGKLGESGDTLSNGLRARDEVMALAEKIYCYAMMKSHEDTENTHYQSLRLRAEGIVTEIYEASAFIEPEILKINNLKLEKYVQETFNLKQYEHYIKNIIRLREHILSEETEAFLAKTQELGNAGENIYSMLNDADMRFKDITDENGNPVELTHGRFISFLQSKDINVRKSAYENYYQEYQRQKNTFASVYYSSVKKDLFFSDMRRYESPLHAALSGNNIPREVYHSLINAVSEFLPAMHEYVDIRKKRLELPQVHFYDLYTPIVKDADTKIDYEEACSTVLSALAPMGEEYTAVIKTAMEKGWIDVYENMGKHSGAYCTSVHGVHPYILLNFDNKINDMFTLAHELGHAMHSYYASKKQPYIYSSYSIFLAEIASTVNEALLMEHMLKNTHDQVKRDYLVNYHLEQFRGTVFRQTMFAEFELKAHEMAQNKQPLTVDVLNNLYRELNLKYYGKDIVIDSQIEIEWARIPHFYSPFYVYQYATGYCAAVALSKNILDKGKVGEYIEFLSSGSSDYPVDVLKKAGVDMTTDKPIKLALSKFTELLAHFKK